MTVSLVATFSWYAFSVRLSFLYTCAGLSYLTFRLFIVIRLVRSIPL